MDEQKKVDIRSLMSIFALRDILIENGLTTHADFEDRIARKIEAIDSFSEETKRELKR